MHSSQIAAADQTAAELRDRRSRDGHTAHRCDAFDPCADCASKRRDVQRTFGRARIDRQIAEQAPVEPVVDEQPEPRGLFASLFSRRVA